MSEINSKQVLLANKAAIIKRCQEIGISKVVIRYEGSGDSGGIESVTIFNTIGIEFNELMPLPKGCTVKMQQLNREYHNGADTVVSVIENDVPLLDACEQITDCVIVEACHKGYENDYGGSGELVIEVTKGVMQLHHVAYIVEELHDTEEF